MTSNNSFNPIKEEKDGVRAKRVIWSTAALDRAIAGIKEGRKLVANPFYDGNIRLLKGDLIYQRTEEEKEEWRKCFKDIIYFAEKYCKLMTPQGIQNITLRPYQIRYLKHIQDNQLSIGLTPRQAGKTTTTAIALLHYMLFNVDKFSLICSNKRKSAVEVVDKIKKIYVEIPYFLKPGIYKWNEAEIVMDNGCRIQAEATTINSGIGNTIHFLLLDEFAHVPPNIIDKFYNNIFPTISAAKAKCAIISTQNGRNLFYRLFTAAKQGDNDYKAFEITWKEIPEWNPETQSWEERDEAWHKRQIANYGSEEAFNSQFGTNFDIGSNTLIPQRKIRTLNSVSFINKDIPGVSLSDCWYWHPEVDPTNLRKEFILTTCDLAEGIGQDHTVFEVFRMVRPGTDTLELVGYFRTNTHARELCARSLMEFYTHWISPERGLISFERNTYGEIFLRDIQDLAEKEITNWDPHFLIKYQNESGSKSNYGIKVTPGNKTTHCLLFKESVERDLLVLEAEPLIYELHNFCDDGSGHYKASFGHDDMVMSAVQTEFAKRSLQYRLMRDDFESGRSGEPETVWNPYEIPAPLEEDRFNMRRLLGMS